MNIVFSDLDGTLLDHNTYSYAEAEEGLRILNRNQVPLVLVSSKTFPEMKELHGSIGLDSPFIFENGGGIAYYRANEYQVEILGSQPSVLRQNLDELASRHNWSIKTIIDMTIDELMERTGLAAERAGFAQQRRASLPFIFLDTVCLDLDDLNTINSEMRKHGCFVTKGGRFYHISSIHANKGNAIQGIIDYYQQEMEVEEITTIAIGDSENDLSMLRNVDKPFLVRKYDNSYIETGIANITVTDAIGPAGFTEAVKKTIKNQD